MGPVTRLRLFAATHPLLTALGLLVVVYLVAEHRQLVVGAGIAAGVVVFGALVARAASWRSGWAGPAARIRNPDPPSAASWGRDPSDERRTDPVPIAAAPAPPAGGPVLIQVGAVSIVVPQAPSSPTPAAASAAPALPADATWIREPAGALPAHVREVGDVG